MKSTIKFFQICLLLCEVFDVDADEVKTVSVMEGDSVTLNTDLTKIQGINLILWTFGNEGSTIAQIDGKKISYPYLTEIFGDRLQLDHQTGSLTIKNMRTNHTGPYKQMIIPNSGSSLAFTISVTVYESPSVIDAGKAEMKSVSVKDGDSVTLQTDVTETHGDELIVWRFGDEGKLIAKCDIEAKSSKLYEDTDERFRDRLKLDEKTGSLTFTNTRTTDSGLYRVKISSSKQTLYKRFSIIISEPGLSPGAVAGIVVGVLLLVCAAAGVIYYLLKIPTRQKQTSKTVMEGDPVTLKPVTEINKGDWIQLTSGDKDTLIAQIKGGREKIITSDGRIKGELQLDKKTGSFTITDTRTEDSGVYKILIRRGIRTLYEEFYISVIASLKSVKELRGSVTLDPETEIQKDDQIQWMFGDQDIPIAEIRGGTRETRDDDVRFRGRLTLDEKTGTLIIARMRNEHTGVYKLQISSSRGTTIKRFKVIVAYSEYTYGSVKEGTDVTLPSDTYVVKDEVNWFFNDEILATGKNGDIKKTPFCDERFKDRLKLDHQTGDLTIKNTRPSDTGVYRLKFLSLGIERNFSFAVNRSHYEGSEKDQLEAVILYESNTTALNQMLESESEYVDVDQLESDVCTSESVRVLEGDVVTLRYDTYKVKDEVKWFFNDEILAIGKIGHIKTTYCEKRFQDRLKLDDQTGTLTIKNARTSDNGVYCLKLLSRGIERKFVVIVNADSSGNRVNDSAVEMPPVNEEDRDVGNEEEGMSLLVMR